MVSTIHLPVGIRSAINKSRTCCFTMDPILKHQRASRYNHPECLTLQGIQHNQFDVVSLLYKSLKYDRREMLSVLVQHQTVRKLIPDVSFCWFYRAVVDGNLKMIKCMFDFDFVFSPLILDAAIVLKKINIVKYLIFKKRVAYSPKVFLNLALSNIAIAKLCVKDILMRGVVVDPVDLSRATFEDCLVKDILMRGYAAIFCNNK